MDAGRLDVRGAPQPYSLMLDLFRQILNISDASIDQAMAAALPTADSATRRLMALCLLQRRHPASLVSLILHFHVLPADVQRTVIQHLDDIPGALRHASRRRGTQGPGNVLTIIERSRATSMGYLITEQLRHGEGPLRAQAAGTILTLARQATTSVQPGIYPHMSAGDAARLISTVTDAMGCYLAHQRDEALLAVTALLPRAMPEAMGLLSRPEHATVKVMLKLIAEAGQQATIRQALPLFVAIKPLRGSGLTALRVCFRENRFGELLANHHLLLLPGVRQAITHAREPASLCPKTATAESLPAHQRRGLLPWMDALGLDVYDRVHRLEDLSQSPDPAVRLGVLRRMIAISRSPISPPDALDQIAAFTRDADPRIARIALWQLIQRKYPDLMPILGELLNARDQSLRRIAGKHLSPLGFSRLWESWSTMPEPRRQAAGRALIKIDPDFHRQLGLKLARPHQHDRLRALAMIRELNQGVFFELDIAQLLHDQDEKVASAAARALGAVDSQIAIDSLERALDHHDSRVRANAVEALSQAKSTKHVKRLLSMAEAEENRPRANAIGALMQMRTDQAISALQHMLLDPRADHRVSALWLVNEMGLLELARHVAEMSISDDDSRVKRRATDVTRQLLRIMTDPGEPGDTREAAG